MRILVFGLLTAVSLLPACTRTPTPAAGAITRDQAIARAVELASTSIPELGAAQETPKNISAELTTLFAAREKLGAMSETLRPEQAVWLVTMEGTWPGPDLPTASGEVTPTVYHHYDVILDAGTGERVEMNVR